MPLDQIDELMHIWASMPKQKAPPPHFLVMKICMAQLMPFQKEMPHGLLLQWNQQRQPHYQLMTQVYQAGNELLMRWFFVVHKPYWTTNYLILNSRIILTTLQNWCMEKMVSVFGQTL